MKTFITLFIIFIFFPIPLNFYIYFYHNCYYIKLYRFTLFNNKKGKRNSQKNHPPIKKKSKLKKQFLILKKSLSVSDIKKIISIFYNLNFKPIIFINSNLEYCLDDAAKTAESYGALSNLPSIIYFFSNILFKTKRFKFKITPKFINKLIFKFESKSIIFISPANIIYMIFILIKNLLKIKKHIMQ